MIMNKKNPQVLFCIPDNESRDFNTIHKPIYYFLKTNSIECARIVDRKNKIENVFLDESSINGLSFTALRDEIKFDEFVIMDVEAEKYILNFNNKTISFIFAFSPIFNDFLSFTNYILARLCFKLSIIKARLIRFKWKRLSLFNLIWSMRQYGCFVYRNIVLKSIFKSTIKIYLISNYTRGPNLKFLKIYINYISNSCRDYFDRPKADRVLNKIGLLLGNSPSHFDNAPNDSDYQAAEFLAKRLASCLMINKPGLEVVILPHPRDAFFAEQISALTGFEIEWAVRPLFFEYIAFPSSYLDAITERASIEVICFLPELGNFENKVKKQLYFNYLLANNVSQNLGLKLLRVS